MSNLCVAKSITCTILSTKMVKRLSIYFFPMSLISSEKKSSGAVLTFKHSSRRLRVFIVDFRPFWEAGFNIRVCIP